MNKTISRIVLNKTAEGENVEFVYSVINEDGEYVQRNLVKNLVAVNKDVLGAIGTIRDFLIGKIPDIEQ